MGGKPRTAEAKIERIASSEWGVVTRAELLLAGVSARQIERRAAKGLLIPEYRGVYRVGHRAPSTQATYLAAVKACGKGAVLCGRAAAYHLGILRTRTPPPPEVMCPTERDVEGLKTRRCRRIHPLEVAPHEGIPTTTVPRTSSTSRPYSATTRWRASSTRPRSSGGPDHPTCKPFSTATREPAADRS